VPKPPSRRRRQAFQLRCGKPVEAALYQEAPVYARLSRAVHCSAAENRRAPGIQPRLPGGAMPSSCQRRRRGVRVFRAARGAVVGVIRLLGESSMSARGRDGGRGREVVKLFCGTGAEEGRRGIKGMQGGEGDGQEWHGLACAARSWSCPAACQGCAWKTRFRELDPRLPVPTDPERHSGHVPGRRKSKRRA